VLLETMLEGSICGASMNSARSTAFLVITRAGKNQLNIQTIDFELAFKGTVN
jgi:hypothetical protein